MPEQLVSVLELAVSRVVEVEPSYRRRGLVAGKVTAFVDEWARMMRETDNDDPTLREWWIWANVNERSAYRRLAEFRRLFPEHSLPTPLAERLNATVAARSHRPRAGASRRPRVA